MNDEIRKYQKTLIKNILFTVIIVFSILYLADRAVKIYDIHMSKKTKQEEAARVKLLNEKQIAEYSRATELVLKPYLMFGINPNVHTDTININSMGLRGGEIPSRYDDTIRIVVVGGSAAMACGATSDDKTFTAILENELNKAARGNKRYEVINAGLPSAIAMQEFVLITLKIIDLEPDIVIVFDGFNDMVGSILNDKRPGYPWRYSELEKALNISITKAFIRKRLMNYRPTKKILTILEENRLKRMKTSEDYSLNLPAVDFYEKSLDRIAHLLKSYGIKPVFAYQPSIYFKTPKTELERSVLEGKSENRVRILTEMLELGKNAMREAADNNEVIFINCIPAFDGCNEDIFYDTVHFGDRGQEVLGEFLYKKLKENSFDESLFAGGYPEKAGPVDKPE